MMSIIATPACGGRRSGDNGPAGQASLSRGQTTRDQQLAAAMTLMVDALALLDQASGTDSSSVHLHLAIERLRDVTGESSRFDTMAALSNLD